MSETRKLNKDFILIKRGRGNGPKTPQQPPFYGKVLNPQVGNNLKDKKNPFYKKGPSSYRSRLFLFGRIG